MEEIAKHTPPGSSHDEEIVLQLTRDRRELACACLLPAAWATMIPADGLARPPLLDRPKFPRLFPESHRIKMEAGGASCRAASAAGS